MILAAIGCVAVTLPTMATPADAFVRKVVRFSHVCKTVRTVRVGRFGRRVSVRRVCRGAF